MTNVAKVEFEPLKISGGNYDSWMMDAKLYLQSDGLEKTIENGNTMSLKDKAKALIFLRRHIHQDLKNEYLTESDPLNLWNSLKERYDHQKSVMLPNARHEWLNLRFQDFKSVSDYNSAMFRITSRLKLCGEKVDDTDMIEKTLSTFHLSNTLLQSQYRLQGFKKYSHLISDLLIAEQNSELLLKNHTSRPTGSAAFPEVNANFAQGRGRARGRGRGHRGGNFERGGTSRRGGHYNHGPQRNVNFKNHQKWNAPPNEKNNKSGPKNKSTTTTGNCHRCGNSGHWARTCRTSKEKVERYEASKRAVEANIVEGLEDRWMDDTTLLKTNDFFEDEDGNPVSNEAFSAMLGDIPDPVKRT